MAAPCVASVSNQVLQANRNYLAGTARLRRVTDNAVNVSNRTKRRLPRYICPQNHGVGNIAHRSETRDHRKYRSVSLLHLGKPTKRESIFARSWTRNERALGAGDKVGTIQFGGGVIDCTVRN